MDRLKPRVISLLLLITVAGGCTNPHGISGPIYSGDGPAYIAPPHTGPVEPLALSHRLLLIGDAGLFLEDDPTLDKLGEWSSDAANSTVLYLGDNLYNEGLVEDDRERGEKIIGQQLAATSARKILLPGNHDWGLFQMRESSIQNQQAFVAGWHDGNAEFAPQDGCLGPVVRTLRAEGPGKAITLVLLDPSPIILENLSLGCEGKNDFDAHIAALGTILEEREDDWVILASHYPIETGGPHGGLSYGSWFADGILNMFRFWAGRSGDTYDDTYAKWIAAATPAMREHPPELYAAGHDHNLQVLNGHDYAGTEIVSGAGALERVSTVTHLPSTIFAHAATGFVVIDFGTRNGADVAVLRVVEAGADAPVFEMELPHSQ
jgi:hypothetical protein